MRSSRDSAYDISGRQGGQDHSLLLVAAMLVVFGLSMTNQVIPAFHEHNAIERDKAELESEISKVTREIERTQDEIEALDDPYHVASVLIHEYRYRRAPAKPAEDRVQ